MRCYLKHICVVLMVQEISLKWIPFEVITCRIMMAQDGQKQLPQWTVSIWKRIERRSGEAGTHCASSLIYHEIPNWVSLTLYTKSLFCLRFFKLYLCLLYKFHKMNTKQCMNYIISMLTVLLYWFYIFFTSLWD